MQVIFMRHAGRDFGSDFIVETGLGVEANTVFMPLHSSGAAPTMCKRLVRYFQITLEFREPDNPRIPGNRTTIPPPRERHPFRSHRMGRVPIPRAPANDRWCPASEVVVRTGHGECAAHSPGSRPGECGTTSSVVFSVRDTGVRCRGTGQATPPAAPRSAGCRARTTRR